MCLYLLGHGLASWLHLHATFCKQRLLVGRIPRQPWAQESVPAGLALVTGGDPGPARVHAADTPAPPRPDAVSGVAAVRGPNPSPQQLQMPSPRCRQAHAACQ
ncbi:hypothetical protein HaLaN_31066 [Haematococcus lacustris]|uniref:Uncharacterized protein n=1 Tax=Haematococcus lacustris TaxID=44745 RepID=A0A6A0AH35_HAELA|nr:hypothetical protein HaLaN_31066 [Haematococcus lacustris]